VRERGVPHRHLDLLGCRSITELEVFDRYPAMRVQHETAMLVREGFVTDTPVGPVLTPKGVAERARELAEDAK
jgi:hypothetical protein